jgi:drug/metabolite transporter (DMT)-like permease
MENIPRVGEISALLTAIVWAGAVIMFRKSGEKVHPIALNLFKNILVLVLMVPTIYLFGQTLSRSAPFGDYALLMLSGAIGIGIGDTLLLKCLNQIGAGRTAIVGCLYSPFIITLSIIFLGEHFTIVQGAGALLVVLAVLSTTGKGELGETSPSSAHTSSYGVLDRRTLLFGILWGVLAEASVAVSIVMIKPLLTRSPLLWATEFRLIGAAPALGLILLFHPYRRKIISSLTSPGKWGYTFGGSFTGQYVAMLLWLAGMKYAQASVASALNQTSTIFVVFLAAIFLKERLTARRIAAAVAAVLGALLVTFG